MCCWDFTQAVITQPTLALDVDVRSGAVKLMTRPGIVVDADDVIIRSGGVQVKAPWGYRGPSQLHIVVTGRVGGEAPGRQAAEPELLAMADQAAQALHDRRARTVTLIVAVRRAGHVGKSTIAAALGTALCFPVLSSTRSRRRWR